MTDSYFFTQMVNIMCAPLYVYDTEAHLDEKIGGGEEAWWVKLGYDSDTASGILTEKKEYPVICAGENGYTAVVIYDGKEARTLAAGPVLLGPAGMQSAEGRKNGGMKRLEPQITVCSLGTFVSGCLLLYWKITGKEMSAAELWECNRESYEKTRMILKRISEDVFYRQENFGRHNPYQQELRELESIKTGDKEALRDSISETYEGSIGILAREPLRHYKNVAIGNITLASRAAIEGGMSAENSFSMADSMIQQVEEINNIPEVEAFKRECQYVYAEAVKEEKDGGITEAGKNPLVGKVKDYIFSHLHDRIKVSDIAESLRVIPNYLSSVFSRSENITLKKYILQEKIRRSQNLLKYSDYRIQEIGFYLGFSSQSHFTRSFQEMTGIKPNEYRKIYGNREKWKQI